MIPGIHVSHHKGTPTSPSPAECSASQPVSLYYSPSKVDQTRDAGPYLRRVVGGLGVTASGSFLVSRDPMKSAQHIHTKVFPAPDQRALPNFGLLKTPKNIDQYTRQQMKDENALLREQLGLARNHIGAQEMCLEASHAYITVAAMQNTKLNEVLHLKENKKPPKKTLFVDGLGRHLTDEECIQHQELVKAGQVLKEAAKVARATARKTKKSLDEVNAKRWKDARDAHAKDIENHAAECAQLKNDGVPKKHWPARPVRVLKKDTMLASVEDEEEPVEEGGEGQDGDEEPSDWEDEADDD